MSTFDGFYKLMSDYYKARRDAVQSQNDVLWNVAVEMVRSVAESEGDGSGINDLKERAETARTQLIALLDAESNSRGTHSAT